ncbi:hypothetical protein GF357_01650 [Candidatus Dojkabacteria bacterium]|nr:hypothetical protein [Candidatus Dojkabacteria bacterium]
MKNLTGFLKKTLLLLSSFSLLLFTQCEVQAADSDVSASVDLSYIFDLEDLEIQFDFTVTNNSDYPSVLNYYTLNLPFTNITRSTFIIDGTAIQSNIYDKEYGSDIILDLNSEVVKSDRPVKFSGTVLVDDFISQANQSTRKIILPTEISTNIATKSIEISYNADFGAPQYLSVNYSKLQKIQDYYNITVNNIGSSKQMTLIFGENVAYDFAIEKTVANNDSNSYRVFDIALPKHHHNQLITLENVEPLPDTTYRDADSNIFLSYNIPPNKALDVKITGTVAFNYNWNGDEIGNIELALRSDLIENSKYWEIAQESELSRFELFAEKRGLDLSKTVDSADTKQFQKIAYDYVIDRLSIKQITTDNEGFTSVHGGADAALERKSEAKPEDYSDLLIALLRRYNIPARMSIGYVVPGEFSNEGFFHYWVETWQPDSGWVILDPALDDLLTKSNYFAKQSYEHITILSRGTSSLKPKLPVTAIHEYSFTPSEDIFERNPDFSAQFNFDDISISDSIATGYLTIKNTGSTIIKDFEITESPGLNLFYFNNILLVPGQELDIPINYELPEISPRQRSMNNSIDLEGVIAVHNLTRQRVDRDYTASIQFINYWWWNLLLKLISILLFISVIGVLFTIFRRYVKFMSMRRHKSRSRSVLVLLMTVLAISFSVLPVSAQANTTDQVDTPDGVEQTQEPLQEQAFENAEIEVELGTQSVWNKSIPVNVSFTPHITSENTEISWDVPAGIELIEEHPRYISTVKDQPYSVRAVVNPIKGGDYRLVVNITSWTQTNYTTSKSIEFTLGEDLIANPPTDGYSLMIMVKYGVLGLGGLLVLGGIGFGGKFLLEWLKKYFSPPEI